MTSFGSDPPSCETRDGTTAELQEENSRLRQELELLREKELLYRTLAESANDFIFVIDRNDRVRYVNAAAARTFHVDPEQIIGQKRSELFRGADGERQRSHLLQVFESGQSWYAERETRFPAMVAWLDTWLIPIPGRDGTVSQVLGISRDITQRKMAERSLRERVALDEVVASVSRKFINLSGNEIDQGILDALEQVGRAIQADRCCVRLLSDEGNPLVRLYEWDAEATAPTIGVEPQPIQDFLSALPDSHQQPVVVHSVAQLPSDSAAAREYFERRGVRGFMAIPLFRSGTLTGLLWAEARQGEVRWPPYCASLMAVVGEVLAGALARKRAEETVATMAEELLKAQKLESIGILAGGIAHDFNNILSAIWGNLSLARICTTAGDRAVGHLAEAEKALARARDLTQQLLTFSRGGAPVKRLTALPQLVRDSVGFATRGSNARCEFDLPVDLWNVEIDDGQISQVLQNLAINAIQAMPDGGVMTISAQNVQSPADLPPTLTPGQYVRLAIVDEGVGIPQEHLPKMFVPYFTTKPEGSGLGLATSYSIIRKHGGHMTVQSQITKGSTFTIYLPAVPRVVSDSEPEHVGDLQGQGRILVVDDDEGIRLATPSMLQLLGYDADVAADGPEAVATYCRALRAGNPFDAVILDLTLPGGVGGRDIVVRLKQENPDVAAIASSGYSTDPVMANYRHFGFRGTLRKPYGLEQLGAAIKEVLGACHRAAGAPSRQTHVRPT